MRANVTTGVNGQTRVSEIFAAGPRGIVNVVCRFTPGHRLAWSGYDHGGSGRLTAKQCEQFVRRALIGIRIGE